MKVFESSFQYKVIYIFEINDNEHKGLLKIGDATLKTNKMFDDASLQPNSRELNEAAKERIRQYTNTAGINFNLLYTELAVRVKTTNNNDIKVVAFRDHEVHEVLENSGFEKAKINGTTGKEWYKVNLDTAVKAIDAVKKGYGNLSYSTRVTTRPIIFRPEQEEAISKTVKKFKNSNKMLWNAKMRFGKTLCALEVVKRLELKKTIIITHRPVVDFGWYEDFIKIFNRNENYIYGSKHQGNSIDILESSNKNYVYFASMQDLRGSNEVGGKFDKNNRVFGINWDLVIVDEAHEGTQTVLGNDVIKAILKDENKFTTKFLALSGTPFNILNNYDEDSIYTWDYMMEQECKNNWSIIHFGDYNPYEDLPELKIYTYDLGNILKDKTYEELEDKAFNFKEFFRTWTGNSSIDGSSMPNNANVGDFVHSKDILSFLNLISKEDENSKYPYSTREYRDIFKHSLWMLPGVKEARALSKMLKDHPVFGFGFNIVNVAGDGDDDVPQEDALKMVNKAIADAEKNGEYTITLSCGKLTTGVTIPEWTSVMMLAGSYSTSAANYLQTIFRVQSPCNKNGQIKTCAYVFDFAPDRTLKMIADSVRISARAGKTTGDDRTILGKFLNYCPVISIDGTGMKQYSSNHLLQQLKRAYAERVVRNGFDDPNIYNDELLKLNDIQLKDFEDLKGIIGSSKAAPNMNQIDINKQGFTEEEYEEKKQLEKKPKKERTLEEQKRIDELNEKNKTRRDAISVLRGISIRLPLMIYGADVPITNDIKIEDLPDIVDDQSWEEFMPKGVTKEMFKKFIPYYDQEVFISAGHSIRNTIKSADELDPLERTKKVAMLFNCFKNPDKETVLTPWRVVNIHLSDTIGGYKFYDDDNKEVIETPKFVDQGEITNKILCNEEAKILEINSKTGLYPLYVAYSIFRYKIGKEELIKDDRHSAWDEVIKNNIYVICKTPMAKKITQRTLIGFRNTKVNAHYFEDIINYMKNKGDKFVDRVSRCNYWDKGDGKMKFDAVIGNPPYQENIANRSEQPPVYHLFYDAAIELSNYVTLITPARFLFDAGKTPSAWNKKMLNDEHFKVIKYFSTSKEVFNNVDIKGGVAITIHNNNEKYEPIKCFVSNSEIGQIINTVTPKIKESLSNIIYSNTSYKYSRLFFDENAGFYNRVSGGSRRYLSSSAFEKFSEVFFDKKPNDSNSYAKIIGRQNNNRTVYYFDEKYLNPPKNYKNYKVFLASSNGSGVLGEALSEPIIGEPFMGATETFVSFGNFQTELEAKNLIKYIKTKFLRMMLGTKKVTQGNKNALIWSNIPLQDFTNKSDIDWSKSISEIDAQLYKKYNLSDEEIEFIETNIKDMQ